MRIVYILHILNILFQLNDFFLAITGLLDSDDSNQEHVQSPPLSCANSPGLNASQPVPPPVPLPPVPVPLDAPQPVPPQQPQPVDMIGIMQASGGPGMLITARGLNARMQEDSMQECMMKWQRAAHNLKNPFQPIHNPSQELVSMSLLLLSWYLLYRRQMPSKDEEDIKTLKELGEE
jgi:hypothetical protein